jgi:competence protein ComGC
MRYTNFKLIVFLAFLLQINKTTAQFIPCERSYTVFYNPLLQKIKGLSDFNDNVILGKSSDILPLIGTSFAPNRQELIKHNGKMYIFLAQTGFIFQMSEPIGDSVVFSKIDNTININYNIDCTNFIYKDQIYNYGGYGFWNKTGHLRKYNTVDMEWDIQPTNIEVFSGHFEWFSPKEGRLYVPFQNIVNKSIKDPKINQGIFDYTSYYLDIKTADWIKIGKVSPELIKLIDQQNNYGLYSYDQGRIFLINDQAYLFDYVKNEIYKSKRADLNQFFIRNAGDLTVFFYKGKYYKYQSASQTFKIWDFNLDDFQLLNFPIWGNDYMNLIIILAISLVIIVIILFIWLFKQSVKKKIEQAQLKVLKTKTVNQAFTETETSLIQLLLNAYSTKQNVEIADINRVLGIKDKNIGLQKKVRSDVINAINDKYVFITQGEINLIGSVRKEDDKRFFEYFVVPTEVKTVQKMIEKK